MKTIAVLLALLLLAVPSIAMPDQPWGNNPDVAKIMIDSGVSVVNIYVWHNNATSEWEAKIGITSARNDIILPFLYRSDRNGLISMDFSQMSI